MSEPRWIEIQYRPRPSLEAWAIPEGPVPESHAHDLLVTHLAALLSAWVKRSGRSALVVRNLALRWIPSAPRVGIDPDVCLLDPAPPSNDELTSYCLWKPGYPPPPLAIEVVSPSHPYKDYVEIQDRYAACGVGELWVLDPELRGPKSFGGPHALQLWTAQLGGGFARTYAGNGPCSSNVLGAWLSVHDKQVVLSDDRPGTQRWVTGEERERAEKERERAEKERERAEKERERAEKERERARSESLEQRVAALEAELGRKG